MNTFFNDLKYAFRMIRRNPGFTAIAVLILAVAIGANTSIFSVVNAVMLRPLPYKDSHELVWIRQPGAGRTEEFRHRPNFLYLREHNNVFESVAVSRQPYVRPRHRDSPSSLGLRRHG